MVSGEPSASPSLLCPDPFCTGPGRSGPSACVCDRRVPTAQCATCSTRNRVGAAWCRSCRARLAEQPRSPLALRAGALSYLGMEGCFRRPPIAANDVLYAIDTSGRVVSLAARSGAKGQQIAQLSAPAACFNRGAIVHIDAKQSPLHGLTLLALSPGTLEAVSLVTTSVETLYRANVETPIAANSSEADATGFRGLAANQELCAFGVHLSTKKVALTIRYFANDRATEQPFALNGSQSIGPALCGNSIALCTDEEAGVFHIPSQSVLVTPLPATFRPALWRTATGPNLPPGGLPITVDDAHGSCSVWIAGESAGAPGVLRIAMAQGTSEFTRIPERASISTRNDGSMIIARADGLVSSGEAVPEGASPRLQPGMPVYQSPSAVCTFVEEEKPGWHHLRLVRSPTELDLWFEDFACDPDSCCGINVFDYDVIVVWLDISTNPKREGIRVAHWALSQ